MGRKFTDSSEMTEENSIIEKDPNIDDPQPTKVVDMIKAWPKNSFCIILNEFCERFSYYGMRSVLTLYLMNVLKFSDDNATICFHAFTVICFSSPLLGSILADGYIGKFWTIFSISILYAIGQIMLAIASTFKESSSIHPYLDMGGLFIIAIGTGGIKPCVSAFGGDQFKPHYIAMISIYFSVFYFTINAGSTISSFISPILRSQPCLGHDSCYPLSFGIPAVLMLFSVLVFVLGSPFYKKVPPKDNVIFRVVGTIKNGLVNKMRSNEKREHWLEHAMDGHNCERDERCRELKGKDKCAQKSFIEDVKGLIRVCVMMLPVPMFWALYDQQGSRWVIQAVAMDAQITKGFALLPDQMSTLNALMILAFIPIFQIFVYPLVEKCGIRTTPLRRMVAGGFLAALSFVICGFVQLAVNKTLPDVPKPHMAFVSVVNGYPNGTCNFLVKIDGFPEKTINANSSLIDNKVTNTLEMYRINVGSSSDKTFQFTSTNSPMCTVQPFVVTSSLKGGKSYILTVTPNGFVTREAKWDKPQEGEGQFAIGANIVLDCAKLPLLNGTNCGPGIFNGSFALCDYDKPCDPKKKGKYYVWKSSDSKQIKSLDVTPISGKHGNTNGFALDYQDVKPGTFQLYLVNYLVDFSGDRTPSANQIQAAPFKGVYVQVTRMGGVYSWTVTTDDDGNFATNLHTIVPENHMNILWQVPQYVVITAAEILFSITGLEFGYAESAPSLKAVMTAIWLCTVAFGDIIIIIIAELNMFSNLAVEMFTYAGVMVVVILIFMLLAIFYYEYKIPDEYGENESERSLELTKEALAFPNDGYDDDNVSRL